MHTIITIVKALAAAAALASGIASRLGAQADTTPASPRVRAPERNAFTMGLAGLPWSLVSGEYARATGAATSLGTNITYADRGVLMVGDCYIACVLDGPAVLVDVKLRRYARGRALRGTSLAFHLGGVSYRAEYWEDAARQARRRVLPTAAVSIDHAWRRGSDRADRLVIGFGLKRVFDTRDAGVIPLVNISYGSVF